MIKRSISEWRVKLCHHQFLNAPSCSWCTWVPDESKAFCTKAPWSNEKGVHIKPFSQQRKGPSLLPEWKWQPNNTTMRLHPPPTPHKTQQPPRPQAESGGLDYKSVVEFINEEAGPVRGQWPSAEAIADNQGEDTLMDETGLKFPFSPRGPCVRPPPATQPLQASQLPLSP